MDSSTGYQTLSGNSTTDATLTSYNATYISNGNSPIATGYLSTGDLAEIRFLNENVLGEGKTATIRLLTKNGAVKPIDLTTPSSMTKQTTYLYP